MYPPRLRHAGSTVRTEIGGVMYEYNVLGTKGPRKMTAAIPQVIDS
jgi:hypothetical protein